METEPREKWALISVYNKKSIAEFAKEISALGWQIIASGGTAKVLVQAGIHVKDVAELVGGGAILKHRVVTLSRELHAGLLADENDPEQVAEMKKLGLPIIDMVVCDFYPLADAIAKFEATIQSVVEQTDIGGPTMVRSAAKGNRIVICRFEDRQKVLDVLKFSGDFSAEARQALRATAEFEVARYVLDSARYHGQGFLNGIVGRTEVILPKGENGYQVPAGFYKNPANKDPFALDKFEVIDGAPLSYINLADIDRLLQIISHITAGYRINFGFVPLIAVGVKHGNACGAVVGSISDTVLCDGALAKEVARSTVLGDARAIFGGVVMCNFPITRMIAETMVAAGMPEGKHQKFDAVIAPSFETEAMDFFQRKGGKCRIVRSPDLANIRLDTAPIFRMMRGGDFLLQPNYNFVPNFGLNSMQVTGESNTRFVYDLVLADAICRTSNSNTITIVKDGMLLGNGVGQQDRVGAAELAVKRARDAGHDSKLQGAVACSDSFFPFADAPKVLIDAGIKAIFSTSGSINNGMTQELCEKSGVTLYRLPDSEARGFFGH